MPCGGVPDVFATDDVGDFLLQVVDAGCKLVGPAALAVLDGKVAALHCGVFCEISQAVIAPLNYFVCNLETEAVGFCDVLTKVAAFALVDDFAGVALGVFGLQLLAAAGAGT